MNHSKEKTEVIAIKDSDNDISMHENNELSESLSDNENSQPLFSNLVQTAYENLIIGHSIHIIDYRECYFVRIIAFLSDYG